MNHNEDDPSQPPDDSQKARNESRQSSTSERTLVAASNHSQAEVDKISRGEASSPSANLDSIERIAGGNGEASAQETSTKLSSLKTWSFARDKNINENLSSASPARQKVQCFEEFLRSMPSKPTSPPKMLALDPQPHLAARARSVSNGSTTLSVGFSSLRRSPSPNPVPSMHDWPHPCNYTMPSGKLLRVYFVSHVASAIEKFSFRHEHPNECFCNHVLHTLEQIMQLVNLLWCPPNQSELLFVLEGIFTPRTLDDFRRTIRDISEKHGYEWAAKKYISKRSVGSWVSQFVETLVHPKNNSLEDFAPNREELSNPQVAMAYPSVPPGFTEKQRGEYLPLHEEPFSEPVRPQAPVQGRREGDSQENPVNANEIRSHVENILSQHETNKPETPLQGRREGDSQENPVDANAIRAHVENVLSLHEAASRHEVGHAAQHSRHPTPEPRRDSTFKRYLKNFADLTRPIDPSRDRYARFDSVAGGHFDESRLRQFMQKRRSAQAHARQAAAAVVSPVTPQAYPDSEQAPGPRRRMGLRERVKEWMRRGK